MMNEFYSLYQKHPKICTDTRKIEPGCLFFCLKGENFDGNQFAQQAADAGAGCVVTENPDFQGKDGFLVVENTLEALQQLARHHRSQLSIPVIGITGTNGKTTTKELLVTVLQTKFKVGYTQGNLNNHIGVPLTLLSFSKNTELAVVEMGANHVGEIDDLCKISQPNSGLITNIGTAHIEGFGSQENIILTKTALYRHVEQAQNGVLFVNGADAILPGRVGENVAKVFYGDCATTTCRGEVVSMSPYLTVRAEDVTFTTHLTGAYNLTNILAAIAVGKHFGIPVATAADAISRYVPSNNRSQVNQVGSNTLIADFYNANPSSMRAALDNLCQLSHPHKMAILGDMLELGAVSREEHLRICDFCKEHHLPVLLVGKEFASLQYPDLQVFETVDYLNKYLQEHPIQNSMVLVKGSRGIHLEKLKW